MDWALKSGWLPRAAAAFVLLVTALVTCAWWKSHRAATPEAVRSQVPAVVRLADVLVTNGSAITNEIIRLNLACAEGLPGAEKLAVRQCLEVADEMARRVRSETERHFYRIRNNPAEFENSEGFFRMLILTVVLAEDFKITYDPARKPGAIGSGERDGFFADSSSVFLHGLLGPKRQGTCSSMPVLYVAVGRRLGYPLKLVTTKGHLFVRWEGKGERFNVEATSRGLNRFEDEYYRHWPFEITAAEEAAEGYLKSLSPAEELGVFLSIRGMCLREAGRTAEAAECFGAAARFAPDCAIYRAMAEQLSVVTVQRNAARPE